MRVSRAGIERLAVPPLPSSFVDLAMRLELYQRLTARAAAGGNSDVLVAALAANPLVGQQSIAARMLALARDTYGSLLPACA